MIVLDIWNEINYQTSVRNLQNIEQLGFTYRGWPVIGMRKSGAIFIVTVHANGAEIDYHLRPGETWVD